MFFNYYHLQSDDTPDPGIPLRAPGQRRPGQDGGRSPDRPEVIKGQRIARSTFYGLADRDFRRTNVDELLFRFEHDMSDTIRARATAKYGNNKQAYIISQPDDSQGNVQNGKLWRRANTRWSDVDPMAGQVDFSGTFNTGAIEHSFSFGAEASWEQSKRGSYSVNTGATTLPGSTISLANGSNPHHPAPLQQ